jgi:hypothetical protein
LQPGRRELLSNESVWYELETRGATIATVPFSARDDPWRSHNRIVPSRLEHDELIDVERCAPRPVEIETPGIGRGHASTGRVLFAGW